MEEEGKMRIYLLTLEYAMEKFIQIKIHINVINKPPTEVYMPTKKAEEDEKKGNNSIANY